MAHREFIEIRLRKFYPEASIIVRQLRHSNCVIVTQCHILFPIPTGFLCNHRFENRQKQVFLSFKSKFCSFDAPLRSASALQTTGNNRGS